MQRRAIEGAVDLLGHTAFMRGKNPEQVTVTLQALLSRAQPTQRELEILLGMLAKSRYAVFNGPDDAGPEEPRPAQPGPGPEPPE